MSVFPHRVTTTVSVHRLAVTSTASVQQNIQGPDVKQVSIKGRPNVLRVLDFQILCCAPKTLQRIIVNDEKSLLVLQGLTSKSQEWL